MQSAQKNKTMTNENKEDSFLPPDYKEPEGNYMRFQDGENVFRVLSSAVTGFEYWNTDNKPVRSKTLWKSTPKDIRVEKGKATRINHFWVFAVWSYRAEKVQILEVTQKTIMSAMTAYIQNKQWGNPKNYDFTVTKTGSGFDTEYVVMANPHSPAPQVEFDINLEALFEENGDPFSGRADKEFDNFNKEPSAQ